MTTRYMRGFRRYTISVRDTFTYCVWARTGEKALASARKKWRTNKVRIVYES
jgi:hypothetical protein